MDLSLLYDTTDSELEFPAAVSVPTIAEKKIGKIDYGEHLNRIFCLGSYSTIDNIIMILCISI